MLIPRALDLVLKQSERGRVTHDHVGPCRQRQSRCQRVLQVCLNLGPRRTLICMQGMTRREQQTVTRCASYQLETSFWALLCSSPCLCCKPSKHHLALRVPDKSLMLTYTALPTHHASYSIVCCHEQKLADADAAVQVAYVPKIWKPDDPCIPQIPYTFPVQTKEQQNAKQGRKRNRDGLAPTFFSNGESQETAEMGLCAARACLPRPYSGQAPQSCICMCHTRGLSGRPQYVAASI